MKTEPITNDLPPDDGVTPSASTRSVDSDLRVFVVLYPQLYRFAESFRWTGSEPDDLVQEALARVLGGGPLTRLQDPRTYLLKTIVNLAKDDRRKRSSEAKVLARVVGDKSEIQSYPSDLAFLDDLAPTVHAGLILVDADGYSFKEAASILGTTPVALRARVSRARRKLLKECRKGDF